MGRSEQNVWSRKRERPEWFVLGAIENGEMRVEFVRRADRVAHRILCRGVTIAESIEGTPEEDWPASPPFQEVHFELGAWKSTESSGTIGFLVGMAGRSHWSASVEPKNRHGIGWEVACRLQGPPKWLGVRYRLAVPVATEQDDTVIRGAETRAPAFRKLLRFTLDASTAAAIAITSDGQMDQQGNVLSMQFSEQAGAFPRTLLLGYSFAVVPSAAR